MRKVVAYSLVISLGIILLEIFSFIWLDGNLTVKEDNLAIRTFETVMSATILGFGAYELIRYVVKGKS